MGLGSGVVILLTMSLQKLDFVYADHSRSNYAPIIDALKSSDGRILAVEATGESFRERRMVEGLINRACDPECELRTEDMEQLFEYGNGFIDHLVTAFENSGKTVALLDVSSEHRITHLLQRTSTLLERLLYEIWDDVPMAQLCTQMRRILQLDARAVAVRDQIVVSQLTRLMTRYPEQNMTVFQGADHTRVSHALGRIASVRRVFIPSAAETATLPEGVTMQYTGYDLLLRRMLFDLPVSDAQIDELLEYYVDQLTAVD